jgi:hypothetical protein
MNTFVFKVTGEISDTFYNLTDKCMGESRIDGSPIYSYNFKNHIYYDLLSKDNKDGMLLYLRKMKIDIIKSKILGEKIELSKDLLFIMHYIEEIDNIININLI